MSICPQVTRKEWMLRWKKKAFYNFCIRPLICALKKHTIQSLRFLNRIYAISKLLTQFVMIYAMRSKRMIRHHLLKIFPSPRNFSARVFSPTLCPTYSSKNSLHFPNQERAHKWGSYCFYLLVHSLTCWIFMQPDYQIVKVTLSWIIS